MTWADQIKALDNYRCAYCGSTENLNACHIKARSSHPELAKNLDNGITLCRKCHYASHGGSWNTDSLSRYVYQDFSVPPDIINQFITDYAATRIVLSLQKQKLISIKAHAAARGESVNGFINRAIDSQMERDGAAGAAEGLGEDKEKTGG